MSRRRCHSQTKVFTECWSSIIHQPCEEPEPSDLPCTVDITAFSADPCGSGTSPRAERSGQSTHNGDGTTSDSESDSDTDTNISRSVSSTQSSSSEEGDSDSSLGSIASSTGTHLSRSKSPKFAVTGSKNNDLLLTFASIPRPQNSNKSKNRSNTQIDDVTENTECIGKQETAVLSKNKVLTKVTLKRQVDAKDKVVVHQDTFCHNDNSNQSESHSDILAACSLEEIRQEDLAAILSDQQEVEAFTGFETRSEKIPDTQKTDNFKAEESESEIELPQQAVHALIQRTKETSNDSECHTVINPTSLCANTLLQNFVEETQRLNAPCRKTSARKDEIAHTSDSKCDSKNVLESCDTKVRKKRGRPRKHTKLLVQSISRGLSDKFGNEYVNDPNVSPDSGIQNSPDHNYEIAQLRMGTRSIQTPRAIKEPFPDKVIESTGSRKMSEPILNKYTVLSDHFDRVIYASSEPVLYPQRRRLGRPPNSDCSKLCDSSRAYSERKKKNTSISDTSLLGKKETLHISNKANKYLSLRTHKMDIKNEKQNYAAKQLPRTGVKKKKQTNETTVAKLHTHLKGPTKCRRSEGNRSKCLELHRGKRKRNRCRQCFARFTNPVTDSKWLEEVQKLISNFLNLSIGSLSTKGGTDAAGDESCGGDISLSSKENIPEMLRNLKKVCKKRKPSENREFAAFVVRKKKKPIPVVVKESKDDVESSTNEQRLPLKKRHYHVTTSSIKDDLEFVQGEESTDVCNKKFEVKPTVSTSACINNNNAISLEGVKTEPFDCHINQAIEACITRFASKRINVPTDSHSSIVVDGYKFSSSSCCEEVKAVTITTPKKRHRPDTFENEHSVSLHSDTVECSRLDDLMSSRVEKNPRSLRNMHSLENVVSKLKLKRNAVDCGKLSSEISGDGEVHKDCETNYERDTVLQLNEATPTGIFVSTLNLDDIISETEDITSPNELFDDSKNICESLPSKRIAHHPSAGFDADLVVKQKRKLRKRRAINRTGFPNIKKKKKKVLDAKIKLSSPAETLSINDRVPQDGEKYSCFLERTEKERDFISIEKMRQSADVSLGVNSTKWDELSECDSLPVEDRIDFEDVSSEICDDSYFYDENTADSDISLKRGASSRKTRKTKNESFKFSQSANDEIRSIIDTGARLASQNARQRLRDISPASSASSRPSSVCVKDNRFRDNPSSGDELKKKPPRWKKKYLLAGLFSDFYKEDNKMHSNSSDAAFLCATGKNKVVYRPAEHPNGLLPPPYHCGKFFRYCQLPFQLPYDLWWQYTHSKLPGRDIVPSWNYRKIRSNVYNVKNTSMACEPQTCNCKTECEDDCINRLVLSECPPLHKCKNQKIQRHDWSAGIEKFMTKSKGWGIRTNLPIKQSEFILEYVGEVVSDLVFKDRMASLYVNDTHHYCLHLDGTMVIDGHRMGGDGRFVNHSCQPNCEMQKWSVNGCYRMALFALRDIEPGEEITYDYNFSLFNVAEGQPCKCGSSDCRGVIGGKSQRVRSHLGQKVSVNSSNECTVNVGAHTSGVGRVGRPRKIASAKKNSSCEIEDKRSLDANVQIVANCTTNTISNGHVRILSNVQRGFVREHRCFLIRNLNKIRRPYQSPDSDNIKNSHLDSNFVHHLNALKQPRNIKTRILALAEDDDELKSALYLSNRLRDLFVSVTNVKDENGGRVCEPFLVLPSKKKNPEFYSRLEQPIDLTTIEQNINNGIYRSADEFDNDMFRLFTNAFRVYGICSVIGVAATRLRGIYHRLKRDMVTRMNMAETPEIQGTEVTLKRQVLFSKRRNGDEDIIRCICGMFREEGLMIQCERCFVWQHCECVHADANAGCYHCELCKPRQVDYEIALDDYSEHGNRYYLTLMRGKLQLRQGDTVYVLRDIKIDGTDKKHTYETIVDIPFSEMDIFRIERLWKDNKTGERFAYGHHYLRPHETYHEPTRKFFSNEVMRVPLYEAVPVELVVQHCWVMDLNTFCKGRPMSSASEHIYICENRVDKSARLFSRVAKSKFPICTKTFAFEHFERRLKISRTYAPHDLHGMSALAKQRGRKPIAMNECTSASQRTTSSAPVVHVGAKISLYNAAFAAGTEDCNSRRESPIATQALPKCKPRLNDILLALLGKQHTKKPMDVSYLLEGGRRKKRVMQPDK